MAAKGGYGEVVAVDSAGVGVDIIIAVLFASTSVLLQFAFGSGSTGLVALATRSDDVAKILSRKASLALLNFCCQ